MPQALKADIKYNNFNIPVSYQIDNKTKLLDARNVFSNKGQLDTRFGIHRYAEHGLNGLGFILDVSLLDENYLDDGTISDETLLETIQSLSFFKKSDGTKYNLAKAGAVLWSVAESGQHTVLKTGLSSSTVHRAVTFNDRHIIAIGSDGLYAYDGTNFLTLGQAAPTVAASVAASGSGNTLPTATYKVAYTYYNSTTGFETNLGTASAGIAITLGQQIDVTGISATTPTMTTIDKKRVYFKNVTTNTGWFFYSEIALATTTATITEAATSSIEAPETNAPPLSGGGKFIDVFGKKIIYAGNSSFLNDVFFSEEYLPDAYDDSTANRIVVKASGDGEITGIKCGYYTDQDLTPFACIFKKRSIEIYSEIGGVPSLSRITSVGAVNQETIQEVDGNIYFMSENGWHIISNGKILLKDNKPYKLGDGEIDPIFTDVGSNYEINSENFSSFFSYYYPTLRHYGTFISESGSEIMMKAYNYELDLQGFRPFDLALDLKCSCLSEDENGNYFIMFAGANGRTYKYSIFNTKTDYNLSNTATDITAYIQLPWFSHEDYDSTMNFGTLILKAINNATALTLNYFLNYDQSQSYSTSYVISGGGGFILDESYLDVDFLGDNRQIVRSVGSGIYKTAQSISIKISQTGQNKNLGLLSFQLSASKNGNPVV